MNISAKKIISNFSYTIISNLISLIVSAFVILIVPKIIGVTDYGYWQLYLFYSSYVGFLHFGWNDGIYLRYGGEQYELLDKRTFFSQYYIMLILQIVLSIILITFSNFFFSNGDRKLILFMTALCMIIVNIRYMLLYIMQATNKIKLYAKVTMVDRVIYILIIIFFIILGTTSYKYLIIADIFGKLCSLILAMYFCREIVIGKITDFYFPYNDIKKNIIIGSKLMFANIASVLVIGIVRFGIERNWNVATFGKVSLSLSISNLLMTFINTIGIVIFPVLRKVDFSKLSTIYVLLRNLLMPFLLGFVIIFFPIKYVMSIWLPQYADSLIYMGLLFPICIFEGKMALLINTYLKTLRKEDIMLKLNIITLGVSIVLTVAATLILNNLVFSVLSILFLLVLRCVISELVISKLLNISVVKDIFLEIILSTIFVVSGYLFTESIAIVIYLCSYSTYLFYKKTDIIESIKQISFLIRKS